MTQYPLLDTFVKVNSNHCGETLITAILESVVCVEAYLTCTELACQHTDVLEMLLKWVRQGPHPALAKSSAAFPHPVIPAFQL